MKYSKGDRVRHPKKKEWGLGEVLEDSNGDNVRIFFVGAGEKIISLKHAQPEKVAPQDAFHPVLDNLKISRKGSSIKYQGLPQSKSFFLEQYPQGFYGEKLEKEERNYKVKAHHLALELLNQEEFHSLLEEKQYAEASKRALKIVNATNLIFPNEKMALKDGIAKNNEERRFSEQLFNLIYGERPIRERFEVFCKLLEEIEADKWTTVSYFLFIFHPDEFMFVKPTVTQYVAELCGFEINYKPQLNWITYKSVLKLANYLKAELADLNPRDMIDVQSFMWGIFPGRY